MKIVIDIPDSYYSACKDWKTNCVATVDQCIIADGKPYEEENTCDEREKGNCPFYTAKGDV